jgi:hypothetical protein
MVALSPPLMDPAWNPPRLIPSKAAVKAVVGGCVMVRPAIVFSRRDCPFKSDLSYILETDYTWA